MMIMIDCFIGADGTLTNSVVARGCFPPGANVCVAAPGAVLGFYDGGGGAGALDIPPLSSSAGSGAEPRPKSNLVHFTLKIYHLNRAN